MKRIARNRGFSLIELMIAIAIALIVTGSATALMVSIMQANGRNIASTRLTQELRALAEIVARDVKRARYMQDAIGFVGERSDDDNGDGVVDAADYMPVNPYEAVVVAANASANDDVAETTDGICITYSYEDPDPAVRFRSIYMAPNGGVGAIFLARGNAAVGCANGIMLNSREIDVRQLAFNYNPVDDWLRISVSGALVSDPALVRQVSTSVRLRSQAVPP